MNGRNKITEAGDNAYLNKSSPQRSEITQINSASFKLYQASGIQDLVCALDVFCQHCQNQKMQIKFKENHFRLTNTLYEIVDQRIAIQKPYDMSNHM